MIHCPVCENKEKLALVEGIGKFSIHACPECEVQFSHPLSYSTQFYDEHYSSGGLSLVRVRRYTRSSMIAHSQAMLGAPQRLALEWLRQNVLAGSPLLEIGFGSGWFLAALEQQGYLAMGVEVAREPVETLDREGFTVSHGSVQSLPSDWPVPQAMILFEVIEHLPDPVGFMQTLHNRFPHAPLLLSTPSPRRWSLRLGYREEHDYPPYHLTRWNERSLSLALRKAGYADAICLYPRADPAEFYSTFLRMFFARLRLLNMSSPEVSIKDRQGQLLLSRIVTRFPGFALCIHDVGLAVFRTLLTPLAGYFHRKGWSSSSILVIGLPPGWQKGTEAF